MSLRCGLKLLVISMLAVPASAADTRPAVELLCSGFTSIKPEIITVTPADTGASAIGHMGFFRPEHRDTLWRGAAEWIQAEG